MIARDWFTKKGSQNKVLGLNFPRLKRSPDIEFVTALSLQECRSRLAKELQLKTAILGLHPSHPVIERINENGFLISRNRYSPFPDNYHPLLQGHLTPTNDGTLVRAWFRVNNGFSFTIILLGFFLFFGAATYQVVFDGAQEGLLLLPIIFCGLLSLIIWLMSWYKKSKREILASYLQNILAPDRVWDR